MARCSLTQIGVHDKEVEVLLQVTAVFGDLSSEQVEHGPQQVVAQVVAALAETSGGESVSGENRDAIEGTCSGANRRPRTHLARGSGRGGGGGAGPVLQREVGDEDDELGEGAPHLGARALKQVLGEAVGVRKQDVVCKPIADILTVSEQDAEGVVPGRGEGRGGNERFFFLREGLKTLPSLSQTEVGGAYQSLAGPRTTFLVWKPVLKRNLAAS